MIKRFYFSRRLWFFGHRIDICITSNDQVELYQNAIEALENNNISEYKSYLKKIRTVQGDSVDYQELSLLREFWYED